MKSSSLQQVANAVTAGELAVIATDTIYGVVGQALNNSAVEKIYMLKKRTPTKPFIILISDIDDVAKFDITLDESLRTKLSSRWPGPVSIIIDCPSEKFEYLHRGTHALAFRLPAKQELINLINQTGPLVAPSANPEGLTPASNLDEAFAYFNNDVSAYREGETSTKASTIIKITDAGEEIIRP